MLYFLLLVIRLDMHAAIAAIMHVRQLTRLV